MRSQPANTRLRLFFYLSILFFLPGCFKLPQDHSYKGPSARPAYLDEYYNRGKSFGAYEEEVLRETEAYVLSRIKIQTAAGLITVDYYKRPSADENLILVFPVLGGKNIVEEYFAAFFAQKGFDTAIVHRVNDFKDPTKIDYIEEILRSNIIRDRIAMDFFEKIHGKKNFGAFGISRGAINVAMTAGVDQRLKNNIIVMGGTDIVGLFKTSDERRIEKYKKEVIASKNINQQQFLSFLGDRIKTDPKHLASYIDAKNTLMILALFDKTVPFRYGLKLRDQIGKPETIFLFADHFSTAAYTGMVRVGSVDEGTSLVPAPYVEEESLRFYNRVFETGKKSSPYFLHRIFQGPVDLIREAVSAF